MGKTVCPDEVVVVVDAYSTAASVEVDYAAEIPQPLAATHCAEPHRLAAASRRHLDRFWELVVFPKRF